MNYQFIEAGSFEYTNVLDLRQLVLRAPLGMNLLDEDLSDELNQYIAIAKNQHELIACVMAKRVDGLTWKFRQMAVHPNYQRQGIGKALMLFMEAAAKESGMKWLSLHARETAVPFYLHLGYTVVGERFEEVGIPHWLMEKQC